MSTQVDAQRLWQMDRDHFIHPYTDFSVFQEEGSQIIQRASGVHVSDADGRECLDAIAGLWCVNIGHGREEMADAIRDQVMKMQYYNPFGHSTNEPAALLADKLAQLAPGTHSASCLHTDRAPWRGRSMENTAKPRPAILSATR